MAEKRGYAALILPLFSSEKMLLWLSKEADIVANRARKLASLTAAGAGVAALTGTVKAAVITVTPDYTLSFTSSSNPGTFHTPATHEFLNSASGPRFSGILYSFAQGADTFDRFANLYANGHSTRFVNPHSRVAAGKTWTQVFTAQASYARLADRLWGGSSSTHNLPAGNGFYTLFRFNSNGQTLYGWAEYNVAMTQANSSAAADGPNVTIVSYAWDTDPSVHLAAGQTSTVPEPAPFAETALGALVLGAEGLRRWRKPAKKA